MILACPALANERAAWWAFVRQFVRVARPAELSSQKAQQLFFAVNSTPPGILAAHARFSFEIEQAFALTT